MASDTTSTDEEINFIVDQLNQFGYEKKEIMKAMKIVSNKNDINQIMEQIDSQNEKELNAIIINKHQLKIEQKDNVDKNSKKKKPQENPNEILCLYPSDTFTNKKAANSNKLHLRKSPFDAAPKHNKSSTETMHKLLKHDTKDNIYYFPIGTSGSRLAFSTSHFTWPEKYIIFMWVRWKQGGTITTFDSGSYTPIYGSRKRLGCASGSSWKTMDDYELVHNEWQCVIVFGGDNMSKFYIGDLLNEPKSVGHVACDISGHQTYQIGNAHQGPGDVGCIVVFDKHESMQTLIQLYYQSILIMGKYWNQTDAEMIKKMLMYCVPIDGIVFIIFQLVLGRLIDQFNL